jgi:uncharacterized membrane protein
MVRAFQALLALCYVLLAHLASVRGSNGHAAVALVALALLVLAPPMAARRAWGWLALPAALTVVWGLFRAGHAALPLLVVPVVFLALVSGWFGASLRRGEVPRITRIVAALEGVPADQVGADLRGYTRALTAGWACLLGLLAAINLGLALVAVPGGLLHGLGVEPPLSIGRTQWSVFANLVNYGVVAFAFAGEYLLRKRRFPGRYRSFADFVRKLVALGPAFWRDFLR